MSDPIFATATTNPFGLIDVGFRSAPTFVDIDGDGDLDALIGNEAGNTLFFKNMGTTIAPAFATGTIYFGRNPGTYNKEATFVDIDGDGDLDAFVTSNLVITNPVGMRIAEGQVDFGRNTGTTTTPAFSFNQSPFGLPTISNSDLSYQSITLVDIDGDGDLDAFLGNITGNTRFFRNTGTTIAPAFAIGAAVLTNPFGLIDVGNNATPTFVDIDGDGDLDAFIGNKAGDTLFFRNTGTTTTPAFVTGAAVLTNPFGLINVGASAVPTFVDIDGDGNLDALVGNSAGNILFFRNSIRPTVISARYDVNSGSLVVTGTGLLGLAGANNDIDVSKLTITGQGGATYTLTSANVDITSATSFTVNLNATDKAALSSIINKKGTQSNGGTIYNIAAAEDWATAVPVGLVIADLTGNGITAIADPVFTTAVTNPFNLIDVGASAEPTFVDIDGDGKLDALVGNQAGDTLFFKNIGTTITPAFAVAQTNPFGLIDIGVSAAPTFVDINGDGKLDAFVGELLGNTLFFKNIGTTTAPAFATALINAFGLTGVGVASSPTFVDINGDGNLDAFVGNRTGNTLFSTTYYHLQLLLPPAPTSMGIKNPTSCGEIMMAQ